jgi:hypothetical protein
MQRDDFLKATVRQRIGTSRGFIDAEIPLNEAMHVVMPRAKMAAGWTAMRDEYMLADVTYVNREILSCTPREALEFFYQACVPVETYLRTGQSFRLQLSSEGGYKSIPSPPPSDDEVRSILSQAFHIFNPQDFDGASSREAIATAVCSGYLGSLSGVRRGATRLYPGLFRFRGHARRPSSHRAFS